MASTPALEPQGPRGTDSKGLLLAEQLLELAERAQSYTAASGATIALVREGEMLIRTSNGTAPEVGARVAMDEGICGICAGSGKPQICTDAETGSLQVEGPYRAVKIRSMVAIPVHCNKQVKAVLTVLSQLPNAFSRTHVAILMTLRDVIGAKLEENPEGPSSDAGMPAVRLSSPSQAPTAAIPAASAKTVEMKPQIPKMDPVRVTAPFPQSGGATQAAATPAAAAAPAAKFSSVPAPAAKPVIATAKTQAPAAPAKPAATAFSKATGAAPVTASAAMSAAAAPAPAVTLAKADPDLLIAAEEPGAFVKAKARAKVTAASEAPTAALTAYGAQERSGQGMKIGVIGGIAAIVVVGVALGLHFYHDRQAAVQAAETQRPTIPVPAPAPVSVEPARLPEPQPAPVKSEAASPSKLNGPEVTVKNFKSEGNAASSSKAATKSETQAQSKPTEPVQERAAAPEKVLKLAPPAADRHEEAEAPSLALATAGGFPNLPTPTAKVAAPVSTIVAATLVRKVDPIYPQAARSMGQEAIVRVTATIGANGAVTSVKPVSGPVMFQMTAVEAVKQWKYKPATLNGKPVESTADIVLKFAARR